MTRRVVVEDIRREQMLQAAFDVAAREGIGKLTVRGVAAEAGLSHALVLFYFKRKDRLILALLEWLIDNTAVLHVTEDIERFPVPIDRLHALLQQEIVRVANEPRQTRLFFEFWALGARDAEVRELITAELERYRATFRKIMEELFEAEPTAFADATPDGLAAIAVSWIQGCAVQAVNDPEHFDTHEYLTAVRSIVGQFDRRRKGTGKPGSRSPMEVRS